MNDIPWAERITNRSTGNGAVRLARDLRNLQTVYGAQPEHWNPAGTCLVRLGIDAPLGNDARTATAVRAFIARTDLAAAGATLPIVRLFRGRIADLKNAADEIERQPNGGRGQGFIDRYVRMHNTGDVGQRVGAPEAAKRQLEICWSAAHGEDDWPGIVAMLTELGGWEMRSWSGVAGLGYGSVRIDHGKAADIVKHPLVRHVDVVPRIVFSDGTSRKPKRANVNLPSSVQPYTDDSI